MWFETDYRRIFMDMHLNDSNPAEYLSKLDTDDFVAALKEAHTTSVVVKAQSHVGLHYWNSKYGRMHEGLKRRNLDYVKEMTEKCHANGISVIVYLSQVYDNYAYDQHPAWRIVDEQGRTSRENGTRYGLVCPNNLEYRAYVRDVLTELATNYSYEGMFLDMPFWPCVCHCPACRERFYRETGMEIPHEENWDNPVWVTYVQARQRWIEDFMLVNTAAIKAVNPAISIEHNFAAVGSDWLPANTEEGLKACDYAGGDYYGGYLEQTFMCKYYNSVTPNKPFSYITSRCDPNLYFHTVSRTKEDLLIHAMNALVHNGAFSICDAMNPDGTITRKMYQGDIKEMFEITAPFEQYVSGKMLADVAIWYHTRQKSEKTFMTAPMNVAEILRENNVAFNVVGSKNIADLKEQVLCLNDVPMLTDQEVDDVERYVKNGGNLFVTGQIGNSRLAELIGVTIKGKSAYGYVYLNPTEQGAAYFNTFSKASPYPIEHFGWEAEIAADGISTLATISYPYTKPDSLDFAAIHSNPPGIHTDLPAVIKRTLGKGSILWVAAPLELTKATHCREAVMALLRSLLKTTVFTASAPDFVEITTWEKEGHRYLCAVNQQPKTPVYPIADITVTLPENFPNAKLLSKECAELQVCASEKETILKLPKLGVFQMLQLS